jgi:2-polyprenyl-6-hydroxyphenyl methylase/3-demethylubiquinone-9 3-methyltransferase
MPQSTIAEPSHDTTVDPKEIARFAALADAWWDADGPLRTLHRLNPVRIAFIRDHICRHLGRDPRGRSPLEGLRIADVGCGAGLLSEPMARLGARVLGIDAAEKNTRVAARHAVEAGLDIDYACATAEGIAASGETFDVVLAMEILEHVADAGAFMAAISALVRPGGLVFVATLNRTPQAFAFAIVGAEYLLHWLEPGTHDWHRFLRPAELARGLRRGGVAVWEFMGVRYRPLAGDWALTRDLAVNYMAVGTKADDALPHFRSRQRT